ncbi:MAG TPA: 2-C-methyl-D-erythritol 4-phosphate cytidylyltransferase [Acidimicrobiales bacterium]|nr:2-C-methyl-D-erythritol 4-phosphate cytidylyltransferase [Acidimicrobiales bacterium]
MPGGVWAIVVAAGSGRRFGRPKQFSSLKGRAVLEWAVEAARSVADEVVLVLPPEALGEPARHAGCRLVVPGGATRAASVRAGLALVPAEAEVVVVHDAARPLASPSLFRAVVAAVRAGADGAVPGLALADTVKRVRGGEVVETLARDELVAVQTPQAFAAAVLRLAHAGGGEGTDDACLVEGVGGRVVVVPGEARNLKLTEAGDLERAAALAGCGGVP